MAEYYCPRCFKTGNSKKKCREWIDGKKCGGLPELQSNYEPNKVEPTVADLLRWGEHKGEQ